jgi:spore coat polysaccharide biosynthesis protein SpsF
MIGCIIQARMGSTRLPGKVMKKLDENFTVLDYVITQIKNSKLIDKIVIATTTLKEDDVIADFAKQMNIDYFRGSSQDVLDRYYQCAKYFSFSTIVRITSDAPLIDPTITDQVISKFNPIEHDYVCNTQPRTFPQGTETEVFSFTALEKIWHNASLPSEREHVTPYFYTHFNDFHIYNFKNSQNNSQLRWCIDTKNDLEFVRIIVKNIKKRPILTCDILEFLKKNPEILRLNKDHIINEGYYKSLKEEKEFQKNKNTRN